MSLEMPDLDGYEVKRVPSFQARKPYVCPNCANGIAVGEGHVVAWPEARSEDRRHWHLHCWRVVARRGRL